MRVALIGPPQSGKSTLFAAVAQAGGSHVDLHRADQPHLAVVKVPDARVDWLAELYKPPKITYAELEFLDLPGYDLRDEAGRDRARTHVPAMRQSDMVVLVVREFQDASVASYRGRINPRADVDEMLAEMLFADLDQTLSRIDKLKAAANKPTAKRDESQRELALMARLQEALENERPIASAVQSEAEAKLLRSFAFLSQKPVLVVLNCAEDKLNDPTPEMPNGIPCLRLSARIEEEIARLAPEERADFLADLGVQAVARDVLIRSCYHRLNLASFLTAGDDECRAWTIPAGTDAVTAAGAIHSDIARGFIRAETVAFNDLKAAGDMKGAKAAGKVRLEGKQYVVKDGDIVEFRFAV